MSDFVLLDTIGGSRHYALHPTKPIVAYDAGSMIILWDIISDLKVNLREHDCNITYIEFSNAGNLLFSLDSGFQPTLCLWSWSSGQILQHTFLPLKKRDYPIKNCLLAHSKYQGNGLLLTVIENEMEGFRLSVWQYVKTLNLMFVSELEATENCINCYLAGDKMKLLCVQNTQVGIWNLSSTGVKLYKRIHVQQRIIQGQICELTGTILLLTLKGVILMLNWEGEYISSIQNKSSLYSYVQANNDVLYLGLDSGAIEMYNLSSLTFFKKLPFPFDYRNQLNIKNQQEDGPSTHLSSQNFQKNIATYSRTTHKPTMDEKGPKVAFIQVNRKGNLGLIAHIDSSFFLMNLEKEEILNYGYGHFGKVSGISWQQNHSYTSFVTTSYDLSVNIWKHFGDRWNFSYIDIANTLDNSLLYYRAYTANVRPGYKSTPSQKFVITAMCLHPKLNYLLCGCSSGSLRLFHLGNGELLSHADISSIKIVDVAYSPSGTYILVVHDSGLINLYDARANFTFALQIENHLGNVQDKSSKYYNKMGRIVKDSSGMNSELVVNQTQFQSAGSLSMTHMTQNYPTSTKQPATQAESSMWVITTHNMTSMRLTNVYKGESNRLEKNCMLTYSISEGRISGAEVHPSSLYLVIFSDAGYMYVFRMQTGELRGKIRVPKMCWGCAIDPSGLYVALAAPLKSEDLTLFQNDIGNFMSGRNSMALLADLDQNTQGEATSNYGYSLKRRRLLLYEMGTGDFATEITCLFCISTFAFSYDGRHLSIASESGVVSVWAVGANLRENIMQVLDAMSLKQEFWVNYPIYFYIEGSKGEGELEGSQSEIIGDYVPGEGKGEGPGDPVFQNIVRGSPSPREDPDASPPYSGREYPTEGYPPPEPQRAPYDPMDVPFPEGIPQAAERYKASGGFAEPQVPVEPVPLPKLGDLGPPGVNLPGVNLPVPAPVPGIRRDSYGIGLGSRYKQRAGSRFTGRAQEPPVSRGEMLGRAPVPRREGIQDPKMSKLSSKFERPITFNLNKAEGLYGEYKYSPDYNWSSGNKPGSGLSGGVFKNGSRQEERARETLEQVREIHLAGATREGKIIEGDMKSGTRQPFSPTKLEGHLKDKLYSSNEKQAISTLLDIPLEGELERLQQKNMPPQGVQIHRGQIGIQRPRPQDELLDKDAESREYPIPIIAGGEGKDFHAINNRRSYAPDPEGIDTDDHDEIHGYLPGGYQGSRPPNYTALATSPFERQGGIEGKFTRGGMRDMKSDTYSEKTSSVTERNERQFEEMDFMDRRMGADYSSQDEYEYNNI